MLQYYILSTSCCFCYKAWVTCISDKVNTNSLVLTFVKAKAKTNRPLQRSEQYNKVNNDSGLFIVIVVADIYQLS